MRFYKQKFEKLLTEKEKFNNDLKKEKIRNKLLQKQVTEMENKLNAMTGTPKHKLLCSQHTDRKKERPSVSE